MLCRDGCGISALQIFFFLFFKKHVWKILLIKHFFNLFYSHFFSIISEKEVNIFFFHFFFQKCFLKNWIIFFQKKPNSWHFVTISAKRVLTEMSTAQQNLILSYLPGPLSYFTVVRVDPATTTVCISTVPVWMSITKGKPVSEGLLHYLTTAVKGLFWINLDLGI